MLSCKRTMSFSGGFLFCHVSLTLFCVCVFPLRINSGPAPQSPSVIFRTNARKLDIVKTPKTPATLDVYDVSAESVVFFPYDKNGFAREDCPKPLKENFQATLCIPVFSHVGPVVARGFFQERIHALYFTHNPSDVIVFFFHSVHQISNNCYR